MRTFFTIFKGAPAARQPSGLPAGSGTAGASRPGKCLTSTPSATGGQGEWRWAAALWGGGLPRPAGRKPYGRGAACRSARPHPQASGAGPIAAR